MTIHSALTAILLILPFSRHTAECHEPGHARWPVKSTLTDNADIQHPRHVSLQDILDLPDPPDVTKNDARYQDTEIPLFSNPPYAPYPPFPEPGKDTYKDGYNRGSVAGMREANRQKR